MGNKKYMLEWSRTLEDLTTGKDICELKKGYLTTYTTDYFAKHEKFRLVLNRNFYNWYVDVDAAKVTHVD